MNAADVERRIRVLARHAVPIAEMMERFREEKARGASEEQAIAIVVAIGMHVAEEGIQRALRENHWPHAAHWIGERLAEETALLGIGGRS